MLVVCGYRRYIQTECLYLKKDLLNKTEHFYNTIWRREAKHRTQAAHEIKWPWPLKTSSDQVSPSLILLPPQKY